MNRKKILKHGITVFVVLLFGVMGLGSANKPDVKQEPVFVRETGEETRISSETSFYGTVHNMQNPSSSLNTSYLTLKPYKSLGMVFATSVTNYDEKGIEFASQENIVMLLLREAHQIGADDILNLRVSENVTWVESTLEGIDGSVSTKVKTKTVTITGSAMAIKYLD